jgi:DNA-binding MarR family transcriptional regulator
MNENKLKILKSVRNAITIKEFQGRTGLKMGNLCKHIQGLEEMGFIMDRGVEGKSRVIAANTAKIVKYLNEEVKILQRHIKEFIEA